MIMDRQSINRGKQMRTARECRGISLNELCGKLTGISKYRIMRFESGLKDALTAEQINEIMKAINFPVEWLDKRIGNPYFL